MCIFANSCFIVASHLVASLTMIAALANMDQRSKESPINPHTLCPFLRIGPCESLKPKIIDLAKQGRSPVGAAAVGALVALKEPRESHVHCVIPGSLIGTVPHDVHISSILVYLGNTLPRLDAEIGNTTSLNDADDLPFVLRANGGCRAPHTSLLGLTCIRFRGAQRRTHAEDSANYLVVECSSTHCGDLDIIEVMQL